ncbi:MAG: hypothetical protein Q8Q08_10165 [Candidatus Omnitrophota bacterium]|nr:hypothetical protein [Candidatus Omnitrophota bacterium]MDZ4242206.1 hypothetical protein [Candidatus Omnitrophota bacterium]
MSQKRQQFYDPETAVARLAVRVGTVYFLTLMLAAVMTEKYAIPLRYADNGTPTAWLQILLLFYYGVPVLMAALFGICFRPFFRNFRNLALLIFMIHLAYSFVVYLVRNDHAKKSEGDAALRASGRLRVAAVNHAARDGNKDGRIDDVEIFSELDLSDFAGGEYRIEAFLTQDSHPVSEKPFGTLRGRLGSGKVKRFPVRFSFDPQPLEAFFYRGPVDINFRLIKIRKPDDKMLQIITWSRWAAFLRPFAWGEEDSLGSPREIDLGTVRNVHSIFLMPVQFPARP